MRSTGCWNSIITLRDRWLYHCWNNQEVKGVEVNSSARQVTRVFRLYFMDCFSGHIVRVRELAETKEARAIKELQREQWRGPVELWARDRKVMRREAPASGPAWLHAFRVRSDPGE
jgi:hypothetical protein